MTNAEKYKTPKEQNRMFDCFCHTHLCVFCQLNADVISKTDNERNTECRPKWLTLEAEEEEKKELLPSEPCVVVETTLTKGGKPIATWSRKAN